MYDIDLKNIKKGKSIYYIFLVIGVFMFALFAFILPYSNKDDFDSNIISSRVEIKDHYDDEGTLMYFKKYYYVVDGQEYSCSSKVSSSIKPSPSNDTVYYDSNNPANCTVDESNFFIIMLLVFSIVPIVFIAFSVYNIVKINGRVKKIEQLNQKGKLVKGLKYHLVFSGIVVNGYRVQKPIVEYTLPSGVTLSLAGDPRHDRKTYDADGLVDLLIDENNPKNYFIDFEINRLSGNLPQDYYDNNVQQSPSQRSQTMTDD